MRATALGAVLLAVVVTVAQAAGVYRWVGPDGVTHFSEHPPPGVGATRIQAPPPPAVSPEQANEALKARMRAFEERWKVGTADKARLGKDAKRARQREQNCQYARQNLARMEAGTRRRVVDSYGNVTRMTEEQRQARMQEARGQVEENCSP